MFASRPAVIQTQHSQLAPTAEYLRSHLRNVGINS